MKPPIEARPTSCNNAEFSTAHKELRDSPLFEHLTRTCSTFSKARKTLAYVLRFVNNTRMKTKNRDPISPKELTESELRFFKWCQQMIDVDKLDKPGFHMIVRIAPIVPVVSKNVQTIANDPDDWDDLDRLDRVEFYPDDRDDHINFEAIIYGNALRRLRRSGRSKAMPEVITFIPVIENKFGPDHA